MIEFTLISCSKSKLDGVHTAGELYSPSHIYQKRKTIASDGPWGILSAKYGYLRPWEAVPPYDTHISDRGSVWAVFVLRDLIPDLEYYEADSVKVFAGKRYVDPMLTELEARGYDVIDVHRGLRQGERHSRLKEMVQ